MTTPAQTGYGTTLTLGQSGIIGYIQRLQMPTWSKDPIDVTSLEVGYGWREYITGDVKEPGEFIADLYWYPERVVPGLGECIPETATITIPKRCGAENYALVGSGYVTSVTWPNMALNEVAIMSITFKYDGSEIPPSFAQV